MRRDWLIELGHSRLKLARVVEPGLIGGAESMPADAFAAWLDARGPAAADRFWLAAVTPANRTQDVTERLDRAGARWREIRTGAVDLPVAASYPGLGVDRWLSLQPLRAASERAFCVVDAGTATTIDFVDDRGRHVGGWILPGAAAARAGLLAAAPGLTRPATGREPTLEPARDTAQAVDGGLLLQQVGAVERALREFSARGGSVQPELVLTGGAAASLQSFLGPPVRVEPDLVLHGLAMAVERWRER